MQEGFVGRQPIYSDGIKVFGYELFSKNSELNKAAFANGDTVTAEALLHEFVDVGLARVAGPHPAFVSVTRDFILNDYPWVLPKDDVVLQIKGTAGPDPRLEKALLNLYRAGYSIALEDAPDASEMRPIAEMADIIKVNVQKTNRDGLAWRKDALRSLDVKLVAEGVESYEDYQCSKSLGFDYFEGYFFCNPKGEGNNSLPTNRLSILHLLSTLQNPDVTLSELERAVGQDVAMSHRILRYLNSGMSPLPRTVDSIRHAISLVGTSLIRQWASVLWLNSIEEKPRELMVMSMIRAEACRQLGMQLRCANPDQFFTVGLFSLMDALMDRPMEVILKDLALNDTIQDVLVNRSGVMGAALNCIQAYERCDWAHTVCTGLDEKTIRDAYLSGVDWSRSIMNELSN